MGTYTELLIKADVRRDIPDDVISVLNFLFNGGDEPKVLPDHTFFRLERWGCVGRCSSCYHIPWQSSRYDDDYLFSRSDLKNYEGEIEAFLDWIDPYLDHDTGDCIGWVCQEGGDPRLIRKVSPYQHASGPSHSTAPSASGEA